MTPHIRRASTVRQHPMPLSLMIFLAIVSVFLAIPTIGLSLLVFLLILIRRIYSAFTLKG